MTACGEDAEMRVQNNNERVSKHRRKVQQQKQKVRRSLVSDGCVENAEERLVGNRK